jgi:hypothetical protein
MTRTHASETRSASAVRHARTIEMLRWADALITLRSLQLDQFSTFHENSSGGAAKMVGTGLPSATVEKLTIELVRRLRRDRLDEDRSDDASERALNLAHQSKSYW